MKKILLLLLIAMVFSCSKKEKQETQKQQSEGQAVKIDSAEIQKVGADEDAHGCKSSAGYTWSVLKNECVRIFEAGTRLDPYEQKDMMSAFIIFEENGNRAELFTMMEVKPLILERKKEGDSWTNGNWQLIPWKGYVLKKDGKILFTSK